MTDKYILQGKVAVPCDDLMEWALWIERGDRRVAETMVGPYRISTVFLGLDHQFGEGPPLVFETMVFDSRLTGIERGRDLDQERYSTWEEAELGHERMVERWKTRLH